MKKLKLYRAITWLSLLVGFVLLIIAYNTYPPKAGVVLMFISLPLMFIVWPVMWYRSMKIRKEIPDNEYYANKNNGKDNSLAIACVIFFGVIVILLFSIFGTSGGSTSTNTCQSCHRSYEAGDNGGNFMNISRTGMCNNCYGNYQWAQDAVGD